MLNFHIFFVILWPMDIKFSEKFQNIKSSTLSFLRILKNHYDFLFIILLIIFLLVGFSVFYKFVYLVLIQPIEINEQEIFIKEDLFNQIKDYLNNKEKKFEARLNEKVLNPFK